MNVNDLYDDLKKNIEEFDRINSIRINELPEVDEDKILYKKYKDGLMQVAEIGIYAVKKETNQYEKYQSYNKCVDIVYATFGKDREYPESLNNKGPLVQNFIKDVWLDHKQKFVDSTVSSGIRFLSSVVAKIPGTKFEGIDKRKEISRTQIDEMRKQLNLPQWKAENEKVDNKKYSVFSPFNK